MFSDDDEAEEAIRQAMNSLKNRRLKQEQNKDHDGRDSGKARADEWGKGAERPSHTTRDYLSL